MRFLFTVFVLLSLVACADQRKAPKEMPMSCARQTAMFAAGYHYYWSGDNLAILSDNGDHYTLSDQETEAQFMFDRCAAANDVGNNAGGNDYGNGYGYNDNNGYNQSGPHNRWKQHGRNSRDRNQIRERNNGTQNGNDQDGNYRGS